MSPPATGGLTLAATSTGSGDPGQIWLVEHFDGRWTVDVDPWEETIEPCRQPPVGVAGKAHLSSLMTKLDARNRVELAIWAYETDRI